MLLHLNRIAIENANSGDENRPVGNIAIMSINNPNIKEFISIKNSSMKEGKNWKFNISVNLTEDFMKAVIKKKSYKLFNNKKINAEKLFKKL